MASLCTGKFEQEKRPHLPVHITMVYLGALDESPRRAAS
jgi:hypothetical protein